MSLPGTVEVLCPFEFPQGILRAKRSFVMPAPDQSRGQAPAGIQASVANREIPGNLDSRFRGNDGNEKVDFESTLLESFG